jgi:hypothetical protein
MSNVEMATKNELAVTWNEAIVAEFQVLSLQIRGTIPNYDKSEVLSLKIRGTIPKYYKSEVLTLKIRDTIPKYDKFEILSL